MIRLAFTIGALAMLVGLLVLLYQHAGPKTEDQDSARRSAWKSVDEACNQGALGTKPPSPPTSQRSPVIEGAGATQEATTPQPSAPDQPRVETSESDASQTAAELALPPLTHQPTPTVPAPTGGPSVEGQAGPDPPPTEQPETTTQPAIALPVTARTQTHTIVQGDTLWSLSRRYYGSPQFVDLLVRANNLSSSSALQPGQTLVFPPVEHGHVKAPPTDADHEAVVVKPEPRQPTPDPGDMEDFKPMPPSLSHAVPSATTNP